MNLKLAELLESVPPEFTIEKQAYLAVLYGYKGSYIDITWYKNGHPEKILYYNKQFQLHRPITEGPAYRNWNSSGTTWVSYYYENGNQIQIK